MEGEPPQQNQPPSPELQPTPANPEDIELRPQIYVASLSDYNAGRLHGIWLDADQEPEAIEEAITGMLMASPTTAHAEEWAIHDFDGFGGLHLGEWETLEYVSRVAKGIRTYGPAFAHWTTLAASDEALDLFESVYLGHWPSLTAYAEDVLEDLGLYEEVEKCVPDNLRPYVTLDAAGYGRDLEIGGDILTAEGEGGVYVYSAY